MSYYIVNVEPVHAPAVEMLFEGDPDGVRQALETLGFKLYPKDTGYKVRANKLEYEAIDGTPIWVEKIPKSKYRQMRLDGVAHWNSWARSVPRANPVRKTRKNPMAEPPAEAIAYMAELLERKSELASEAFAAQLRYEEAINQEREVEHKISLLASEYPHLKGALGDSDAYFNQWESNPRPNRRKR